MKKAQGSALLATIMVIAVVTLTYFAATKSLISQKRITTLTDNQAIATDMADMAMRNGIEQFKKSYYADENSLKDCALNGSSSNDCGEFGEKNGLEITGSMARGYKKDTTPSCSTLTAVIPASQAGEIDRNCAYYLLTIRDSVNLKPNGFYTVPAAAIRNVANGLSIPVRSDGAKLNIFSRNVSVQCLNAANSPVQCNDQGGVKLIKAVYAGSNDSTVNPILRITNSGNSPIYISRGYAVIDAIAHGKKSDGNSIVRTQTEVYGLFGGKNYADLKINTKNVVDSLSKELPKE